MSYIICHISYVICHISYVIYHVIYHMSYIIICHISYVIYHMSYIICHTGILYKSTNYDLCHIDLRTEIRRTQKIYGGMTQNVEK